MLEASFVQIICPKLGLARAGDDAVALTMKHTPEWVRTSDPVIRSPARYLWTTASGAGLNQWCCE